MITEQDIEEFKRLFSDRYNTDIDDDAARQKLTMLVMQMDIVYRPITRAQFKSLKKYGDEDEEERLEADAL